MKLGVLTNLLGNEPLEDVLKYLKSLGIEAVELGCGGFPGTAHANAKEFIKDKSKIKQLAELLNKYGMIVSAFSVHGNPVHPNKDIAEGFHSDFEAAVQLAGEMGVERVVTFSGCPGDCPASQYPNWVTCAWPEDFSRILDYQWNGVMFPYWTRAVEFATKYGVNKIGLELHPGFCVYNPETLLKLRGTVGEVIGANFDPSHLFWQGIDPVIALRKLTGAIHHFHAKDTKIDKANTEINGVLDTKSFGDIRDRSWLFRTVGYGHDETVWKDIISELRITGYDFVMSIEHEDALMQPKEGLEKAVSFLDKLIIKNPSPTDLYWA